MDNRYHEILRKHNQEILSLLPYNPTLFNITANEIKRLSNSATRVLEIGCGEGDSALPVLERTEVSIDLLDESSEMISECRNRLSAYNGRVNYICDDAEHYLANAPAYDIIFSSWTIHNFLQDKVPAFFKAIANNLNAGGFFILADKVYPNVSEQELNKIQMNQMRRYRRYLDSIAADAIIEHETEDISDAYRMEEERTLEQLQKAGFRSVQVIDRVERDVVIVAEK